MTLDPITTEVIRGALVYAAEEMGIALRKSAYSPNIKERMDHSCALFDAERRLIAQAEHIPVHLGSMALAVREGLGAYRGPLGPGDMLLLNDPYLSGTHLPDLTLIAPIHSGGKLIGYAANSVLPARAGELGREAAETLVSLPRYSGVAFGIIAKKNEKEAAGKYQKMFNIRTPSLDTRLEYLSGGNQQKVSLAKSIDTLPRILIADEPTRGIDVLAKTEIYQLIHSLAAQGIACLFISSELEEIIGMCHRVIVMKDGAITGILEGEQINEAEIMFYATGIRETRNYDGHAS